MKKYIILIIILLIGYYSNISENILILLCGIVIILYLIDINKIEGFTDSEIGGAGMLYDDKSNTLTVGNLVVNNNMNANKVISENVLVGNSNSGVTMNQLYYAYNFGGPGVSYQYDGISGKNTFVGKVIIDGEMTVPEIIFTGNNSTQKIDSSNFNFSSGLAYTYNSPRGASEELNISAEEVISTMNSQTGRVYFQGTQFGFTDDGQNQPVVCGGTGGFQACSGDKFSNSGIPVLICPSGSCPPASEETWMNFGSVTN